MENKGSGLRFLRFLLEHSGQARKDTEQRPLKIRSGWWYDADGRLTSGSSGYFVYDAAGRARSFGDEDPYKTEQEFDGNGNKVKTFARRWDEATEQFVTQKITYYISSTVLGGQVVTELSEQGAKERTSVFAGGSELASQSITSGTQSVQWQHYDASGASYRGTDSTGQWNAAKELDPLGANAGLMKPITWNVPDKEGLPVPHPLIVDMLTYPGGRCVADGMPIPCEMLNMDNSRECPTGGCAPRGIYDSRLGKYVGIALWDPNAQDAGLGMGGANGWLPAGINFVGGSSVITGWGSSPLIHAVSGLHFITNPRNPENDDDVVPVLDGPQTPF